MNLWRSRAGRSETALPASGDATFIGVDVGGTKILGLITDGSGVVASHREMQPTPKDPNTLASAVGDVVATLWSKSEKVGGIGVGLPGLVDHSGILQYGPNVQGVLGLDIAAALNERFALPAVAENDGYLAALAEHRLGAARGHDHAVIVTQGTGIGGGLVIGGQLLRGAHGFAGEPGHMLVNQYGPACACGNVGCWESVASGAGLANIARAVVNEGKGEGILNAAGGDLALIKGEHVSAAYETGDPGAVEVLSRFTWWVAQGLGSIIALLDPSIIVLGGGLSVINDGFISGVSEQLKVSVVGGRYRPAVPVVSARFGAEAGAVGAAARARDHVTSS